VATDALVPDDPVPSVRAQAERLLINPNTVARAYSELIREGVLRSEQGRGVFVNGIQTAYTKLERLRRLQPHLDAFVHEAVALQCTANEIRLLFEKKLTQLKLDQGSKGVKQHE